VTAWFLHGSSFGALRAAAIDRAAVLAGDTPASVLWLEQNDHVADQVADDWAATYDPLRLTVSSLDTAAQTCYDTAEGPRSLLDALTRRRLVDRALRELAADGVLEDAYRYRSDVLELVSELESDGYDSAEQIQDLTRRSPVPDDAAAVLTETYRRFESVRDDVVTDAEFTGSEAYREVLAMDPSLEEVLPAVDVVVISGYYDLSANQRAFVRALTEAFSTVITLPHVATPSPEDGANAVTADAFDFYRSLVEDPDEYIQQIEPETDGSLADIAGKLYTPKTGAGDTPETLRWLEAPTPEREARQVARSIKHRVATDDEVEQGNVLVVVPGLISYREEIEDTFRAHGLTPVSVVNKLLYQTYTGRAMIDLVSLCRDEDVTPSLLASLGTNPLVDLEVDGAAVSRIARALPTTDVERLLEAVDADDERALQELLDTAAAVAAANDAATVDAVRDLFASVELEDRTEAVNESDGIDFDAAMEARAYRRVERALDAIDRVVRQTPSQEPVSILEIVADELDQIRVPPPRQSSEGVVEVAGPREAYNREYEHLYLVGMTDRDFPPDPERPRFFEALFEGLEEISPTDHYGVARYQFATMLASAETVRITTPDTTSNDEPLLESPVLDELRRVTGIEPQGMDFGNGYREDVQRAIGQAPGIEAQTGVDAAIETGAFDGAMVPRVHRGVTCASNRAAPDRSKHDGQLTQATVDALYPEEEREPYSPTRLNSYAKCGFRFAMERVLDVEEPLEYALEPDPLDYGSLVHDVLEYFYRDLQSAPGDPVDLSEWPREQLERRLLDAGETALEEAEFSYEGAFFDSWLESLFAGLGTPATNPHYGPVSEGGPGEETGEPVHTSANGLFAKFIDEERSRENFAQPAWFEVDMTFSDGGESLQLETPIGTVPVHGRIDRVTVDWERESPEGIVHDYKSSSRSLRRAADGVSFQLPLYALAASQRLDDDGVETPLDAAFYTLDHDDLGDGWSLSYYLYREGDGTDSDYRRLVEDVTPRRMGELVAGLEHGAFQPTVLDADTAGCRHCDFSDVCDVRYHARRDVIGAMDSDSDPGYVPQAARTDSFLDTCGGADQ